MSATVDRGDVIVFRYPRDPKIDYAKRVIGLPGDVVSYKSKSLTINGVMVRVTPPSSYGMDDMVEERFGEKTWWTIIDSNVPATDFEGNIPANNYFVLGDTRDNSLDSRHWGFVPEENILGRVVYVFK